MKNEPSDHQSSASTLLQSIAGDSGLKGTGGRPYILLASKGKDKLYFNLSFGDNVIQLEKNTGLKAAGLIVRFRGTGKTPIPERKGDWGNDKIGSAALLKKYFIAICASPVNGFTLRDKVNESKVLSGTYQWIAERVKESKWKLEMSEADFELYGLSPFETLPDNPPALDKPIYPEW